MIDGLSPHKDTPIVLAIDVGTTNAKAQFFDEEAQPFGTALRAGMPMRPDGTADAELLAAEVERLLDRALADAEEVLGKKAPEAVSLTCAWHGLVGLDRDGNPLTALSTWFDSRAAAQALRLRARVSDLDALHDRTGAPIHPALPPARLLRLREEEPAVFDRVARWASLGEFLHIRWFGPEVPASPSMASGSGLYDQWGRGWDPELCRLLELRPETLPRVRDGLYLGSELRLRESFANRWPVLRDSRWVAASGDGGAAVVGSVACAGEAGLTVGTSAAARVVIPFSQRADKPLPRALFAYLLEEEYAVVGVARSNAGNLIGWGRRVLFLEALRDPRAARQQGPLSEGVDLVAEVLGDSLPGDHGLVVDPSLAGERSPHWPVRARGSISGLRTDTTADQLLRALLEAAVLGLRRSVDELERWSGPLEMVLSGGATRSPGWLRLLADSLDRPLRVSSVPEASLRGAGVLALRALGLPEPRLQHEGELVRPDPARASAYAQLYADRKSAD